MTTDSMTATSNTAANAVPITHRLSAGAAVAAALLVGAPILAPAPAQADPFCPAESHVENGFGGGPVCAYDDFLLPCPAGSHLENGFGGGAIRAFDPLLAPPSPPPDQSPVELCPAGSKTRTAPAGQQCEAAPKPDVQCPPASPVKTVPAGQTCPPPPPPPVTDAISLSFGPLKITLFPPSASITATVSNSSALTAKCTYDATPDFDSHRDFTVSPHGSTDLTFNGIATGTSYHVVVSCHDASGKQTQEIGGAVTDQPF